jgi:AraC-like DNA-binding protein
MTSPVHFQRRFLDRISDIEPFRLLLDLLPDVAFFMKDRLGRFVMHNRRSVEYCQVRHEWETLGKTDYDFFPRDRAALYVQGDQEVMRTGKPIINAIAPAPEASDKMIVYSKVPVYGRNGRVIGVAGIHRIVDGLRDTPHWYGRFSKVIDHIHKHYAEELEIAALAAQAGVSQSQFERRFRQLLGTSPNEYLLRVRVNASRALLETTDRTIADIALSVGFYDHSHFTRTFRRQMSCSPKQYRDHHRRQRPDAYHGGTSRTADDRPAVCRALAGRPRRPPVPAARAPVSARTAGRPGPPTTRLTPSPPHKR